MNIKLENTNKSVEDKNLQPLNESEIDVIQEKVDIPQQYQVETVMNTKSKQFKFQSGAYMAGINSDVDALKFGLKWHAENTKNFDEFLKSVSNFVESINVKLTKTDESNLKQHYQKYWKK